jgi:hypothetical protein
LWFKTANVVATLAPFRSSCTTGEGGGIVPRLTKSDIERALLSGAAVPWVDAGGKPASIQLGTAKLRRLFAYLRNSKIRDVKGLPQAFIDGLAAAYVAVGDPAAASVQQTVNPSASGPWKIQALKIEGFGGVNIWNGGPFELAIDNESLLMEGPNGSGKSPLTAALIWALRASGPATKEMVRSRKRSRFSTQPAGTPAYGLLWRHIRPI